MSLLTNEQVGEFTEANCLSEESTRPASQDLTHQNKKPKVHKLGMKLDVLSKANVESTHNSPSTQTSPLHSPSSSMIPPATQSGFNEPFSQEHKIQIQNQEERIFEELNDEKETSGIYASVDLQDYATETETNPSTQESFLYSPSFYMEPPSTQTDSNDVFSRKQNQNKNQEWISLDLDNKKRNGETYASKSLQTEIESQNQRRILNDYVDEPNRRNDYVTQYEIYPQFGRRASIDQRGSSHVVFSP